MYDKTNMFQGLLALSVGSMWLSFTLFFIFMMYKGGSNLFMILFFYMTTFMCRCLFNFWWYNSIN